VGALGASNLYPVPPRPWSYLPYIAAGTVLAGFGTTVVFRIKGPPQATGRGDPAGELAALALSEKAAAADAGRGPSNPEPPRP